MADPEQLAILGRGVQNWNAWRRSAPGEIPDLEAADLNSMDLSEANLSDTSLGGARLSRANLNAANLWEADLTNVDFHHARLNTTDLRWTSLSGADLRDVDLRMANLTGADLTGANLEHAHLHETVFAETILKSVRGLESCDHVGPSSLDHRTLALSGALPLVFLRGVGLPDRLIEYLPSLLGEPFQFYACFISYSSQDRVFAERLHNDLQGAGVRCWFAPKKLKPGDFFRAEIDRAIHVYDKLLLILSEQSIASAWVADEVEAALERERKTGQQVLFPIQIDDAVKNAGDWAAALRRRRHIGDMRAWKDPDVYRHAFADFLNALRAEGASPVPGTEA